MRSSAVARTDDAAAGRAAPAVERTLAVCGLNGQARAEANGSDDTLGACVLRSLDRYFADLDGARPHQLHEMVMQAVERPLLQFALARCEQNQSAAAELLGINRNTLRKKLIDHGLVDAPPPKPATTRKRAAPARRKR